LIRRIRKKPAGNFLQVLIILVGVTRATPGGNLMKNRCSAILEKRSKPVLSLRRKESVFN